MEYTRIGGGGSSSIGSSANFPKFSAFIQPPLNRFFIPRPPLLYKKPLDRSPDEHRGCQHSGVASFLQQSKKSCAELKDSNNVREISKLDKKLECKRLNEEKHAKAIEAYRSTERSFKSDPYKTLFVGRLPYSITSKQLKKEFEAYGPIKSIEIVEKPGNPPIPQGYAFIEFEREKSVKIAYIEADGRKVDGQRRCVVDVERGRTVRDWLPRRLGGGLGSSRKEHTVLPGKVSGRDPSLKSSEKRYSKSPPPRAYSPPRPYRRPSEEYDYHNDREHMVPRSPKRHHYSNDHNGSSSYTNDRPYNRSISYQDFDRPPSRKQDHYSSNVHSKSYF